jgi:hypothetical protein
VAFGFPDMVVTCPSYVEFIDLAHTTSPKPGVYGTSFTTSTNDVPRTLSACYPYYPYGGGCTDYVVEGPADYCGTLPPPPPNFCQQCVANGGYCKGKVCIYD